MTTTPTKTPDKTASAALPSYVVKRSPVHGNGVFARRKIPVGQRIEEYTGERITADESATRAEQKGGPINHTFFFSLNDGHVIDGGAGGNDSRYINHSCEPNCEAEEDDGRVFIFAARDIECGEELYYNYALEYEERHTAAVKQAFACYCNAPTCTGTMLAPKKRKTAKRKTAAAR